MMINSEEHPDIAVVKIKGALRALASIDQRPATADVKMVTTRELADVSMGLNAAFSEIERAGRAPEISPGFYVVDDGTQAVHVMRWTGAYWVSQTGAQFKASTISVIQKIEAVHRSGWGEPG